MIALMVALSLSSSLSPQAAGQDRPTSTAGPDSIRYEQSTPQRDFLVFWVIDSSGRLVHRSVDPMGRGVEGALELGTDRFRQIVELLGPLDRPAEACGTVGERWRTQTTVSWVRGGSASSLTLGDGCPNARIVEDTAAARQADRLVQSWIAATPR